MSKTYNESELKNAVAEAVKNTVVMLKEEGMLKDDNGDKTPGTFKKLVTGISTIVTDRVDTLIEKGEKKLVNNAVLSATEKAKARELKEAQEAIEKKYK